MNEKLVLGVLFIALVGLLLFTRKPEGMSMPIKLKHYKNAETWDIEWSEDGNRCRVKICRDATQS